MELIRPNINIDFLRWKTLCITASLLLILAGLASIAMHKGLNLGIDFAGGTLVQVTFKQAPDLGKIRESLKSIQLGEAVIQQYGSPEELIIRVEKSNQALENLSDTIQAALRKSFGADAFTVERVEVVGPQVGHDLRRKGLWALVFANIGILIYVALRFEFRFGLGAVIALVHDVLITVGIFSMLNKEFTLTIIAALLTIVGYSVNDTIVVCDRIRERMKLQKKESLAETINRSVNETLSRTILTSLTVFIVVVILFFFGGDVIHDFAFALIVGVFVGSYSTIFIVAPVVLLFDRFLKPATAKAAKA